MGYPKQLQMTTNHAVLGSIGFIIAGVLSEKATNDLLLGASVAYLIGGIVILILAGSGLIFEPKNLTKRVFLGFGVALYLIASISLLIDMILPFIS